MEWNILSENAYALNSYSYLLERVILTGVAALHAKRFSRVCCAKDITYGNGFWCELVCTVWLILFPYNRCKGWSIRAGDGNVCLCASLWSLQFGKLTWTPLRMVYFTSRRCVLSAGSRLSNQTLCGVVHTYTKQKHIFRVALRLLILVCMYICTYILLGWKGKVSHQKLIILIKL